MEYLLTTEPWLPCRTPGGAQCELGIRDALVRAHELESLHDSSPLATLALHRLLLAVLHRVFGPPDLDAWIALFERGRFEAAAIDAYLEKWRHRFDLLHPERPFYQVRGLRDLGYEADGVGRLVLERSNYGPPLHLFQHRSREQADDDRLPFASAARGLVVLHAFAPGGTVMKQGEPGSATAAPLNRGAAVMVAGSSLFETLMFNLLVYDPDNRAPIAGSSAKDSPAWERPALPRPEGTKEPKRTPFGWLDRLTWQSRRLELDVDEERGSVRGVIYCVGQGLDDDASPAPEPMLAYVLQGKPAVLRSVDFAEERAVWRDCHALIRKASADGAERAPMAVRQLARVEVRRVLGGRRQRLWLLGMRGDQARVKLVREEVLTIPLSVVCDESKTSAVEEALKLAEEVGKALRWSVRDAVRSTLAPGERDPDEKDVSHIADALGSERGYWAALSGAFEVFLDGLEHDSPDCARRFVEQARAAAESSLIRATEALGSSARQLQGGARASRALRHRLDELVANTGGTP